MPKQFVKAAGAIAALVSLVFAGIVISSRGMQAFDDDDDDNDRDRSKIQQGFQIAPVPLNFAGKNRALVGLGSYIVNALGDCDGCHSAGAATEFLPGFNPYFGQPKKFNPATYLGGGNDFGPFPAPNSPVHIVSRNLTPDKTGRPVGGAKLSEFVEIMRHGTDFDHLHPTCSATVTTNCLPPPFRGDLLQIMPWPVYQDMTDRDLRAIYEYLSAIPCIAGPPAPSVLHHDCK